MSERFSLMYGEQTIHTGSLRSCFQRLMDMAGDYVAVKVLMGDGWQIVSIPERRMQ